MAHPHDLTDRGTVQAYLSPPVSTPNYRILDMCISGASRMCLAYLNRKLAAASYTEIRNGTGQSIMRTYQYPIIQVQIVQIGSAVVPHAPSSFQLTGTTNGGGWVNDRSMIYLKPGIFGLRSDFTSGAQNVQFVYTAGFVTPGQLACNALPAWTASTQFPYLAQILIDGYIYTNISNLPSPTTGVNQPVFPTAPNGATVLDNTVKWKLEEVFTGLVNGAELLPDDIVLAASQQAALLFKQRDRTGDESTGTGDERVSYFMGPMSRSTKMLLDIHRDITPVGEVN